MTDLVERLRGPHAVFMTVDEGTVFLNEAADEIERLQKECIKLKAVIKANQESLLSTKTLYEG